MISVAPQINQAMRFKMCYLASRDPFFLEAKESYWITKYKLLVKLCLWTLNSSIVTSLLMLLLLLFLF